MPYINNLSLYALGAFLGTVLVIGPQFETEPTIKEKKESQRFFRLTDQVS
jgi:hypothetical protein